MKRFQGSGDAVTSLKRGVNENASNSKANPNEGLSVRAGMAIIFHITTREAWAGAEAEGMYLTETFQTEGFIHCSTRDQVVEVANARFRGLKGLSLLAIDTDKVNAEIRYENLEGGRQMFPHIYGGLNLDAVVKITDFEPGAEGYFALPSEIQTICIEEGKNKGAALNET